MASERKHVKTNHSEVKKLIRNQEAHTEHKNVHYLREVDVFRHMLVF